MDSMVTERRLNVVVMVLGLAAAVFLLDQHVPVWLRILPWALVFGYPVWRMLRSKRSARSG